MLQPIILFAVTVAGFLLAIGHFAWTVAFSGRLVARCRIPGETIFELERGLGPVRIAAHLGLPAAGLAPTSPLPAATGASPACCCPTCSSTAGASRLRSPVSSSRSSPISGSRW